ncbi:unnamed protein product [Symbiodinium microadriaticum]|nr:unnamed protein product [Symbiodinium microadriaticum]
MACLKHLRSPTRALLKTSRARCLPGPSRLPSPGATTNLWASHQRWFGETPTPSPEDRERGAAKKPEEPRTPEAVRSSSNETRSTGESGELPPLWFVFCCDNVKDHAPEHMALREKDLTSLWADQNDLDEEDAVAEEVGVLDVNVPRTALVINISYVLKRLNGCCSLNQLAKALKSFKEKTGMSLEVFLRSNPRTFKLEGRIVYLLDRDGEKWQPPKQEPAAGGNDAGHPERSKGQAKGKEAKGRGGGEGRRGKATMKGDLPLAKGETGKGKASKGHGHEWSEWSWNSNGHWAPAWDEWTQPQPEWKALQRKASRWKAS